MSDWSVMASGARDLRALASAIEAEKAKQAKVEALFPAGYAALTSSERLKVVSRAYQENPGLRREILEFIERDLRRPDQVRALSPEEMRKNLDESRIFADQAAQDQIEREAKYQARQAAKARPMYVNLDDGQDNYNREYSGLMDLTNSNKVRSVKGWDLARYDEDGNITTAAPRKKAAPKPQIPMAPQAGRRKIRLDD